MRILAIETSCDETAIAIIEAEGGEKNAQFRVLGNALLSQVEVHRQYGGVFPNLAKREHAKNLVPILTAALEEAELLREDAQAISQDTHDAITRLLEREPGLEEQFLEFIRETEPPAIDAIAVTAGPGLEPALWVGINFAKALALAWSKPIVAVNHMEGHILAGLAQREAPNDKHQEPNKLPTEKFEIKNVEMPVLALLISGGHTKLVLMKEWLSYELIGQTRDDAVGEAFDKVARMLGLPYPGGPEISRLAEEHRTSGVLHQNVGHPMSKFRLPRPMMHEDSCDFSFAGLKTAVRYLLQPSDHQKGRPSELVVTDEIRQEIAREFEDAVTDVLWKKTERALEATGARTLVIGGGVSANTHIRRVFQEKVNNTACCSGVKLWIPQAALTTDNALMIAMAGYYHALKNDFADPDALRAEGNLRLAT
ncbi:MAG: tRNA (adenosine(37)-N6)-threonylcarbamoyltransferase complex transferase subunit TsaD [bacterium]|nr:tRNA (adenosine(37)-N6)-threonylcarbamoyltransferase complex transferase subunit TsaD [bacterium]